MGTKGLWLVMCALVLGAGRVEAAPQSFLVIGVIASAKPGEGVVLLKASSGRQAFAARVGQEVDSGVTILRATREFVYFKIGGRTEKVEVGARFDASAHEVSLATGGLDKVGNTIKMTAAFRDEILKRQLGKVMMQAAAVPYYQDGALVGFRLWEIDPDSVYDRAGLVNGDIVTALNGQSLSDVGRAVQVMQSLRNESRITVDFIRKQTPMSFELVIQ